MIPKNHMTSDRDMNSANKRLPQMLTDADFGESDHIKMHHIESTQSSLGVSLLQHSLFMGGSSSRLWIRMRQTWLVPFASLFIIELSHAPSYLACSG